MSALIEKQGVGGLDVQSDRGDDAGEEDGEIVGEESGDIEGVESDELESSEDGSGDRGGSSNTSGSSTTRTARVPSAHVMKKYASFRTVKMTRAAFDKHKSGRLSHEKDSG